MSPESKMGLPLRANFRWTLLGNVVNAGCWWGVITAIAKCSTPDMVGRFALGLAIAAPVTALTMLQLRAIQVTDARGTFRFDQYLGTRLLTTAIGLVIIAGIAFLGGYEPGTAWVILLVGAVKSVESVSEIVRGLFQRRERMDLSGTSLTVRGAAAAILAPGLLWITGSVVAAIVAMLGVWLATLVFHDLTRARRLLRQRGSRDAPEERLRPSFDPRVISAMVRRALPLGGVMLLLSLQTNIPRYAVEAWHSEKALGYFAALSYPMVLGTMIVSALGQSASPRLARHHLHDPEAFRRLTRQLFVLAGVLGVAMIAGVGVLGRWVLTVLYRPDYAAYHVEFVLLAVAGAITFGASFCGYALTAAQVFKPQLKVGLLCCVTASAGAVALVRPWGVRGAAWTVIASSAAMLIYLLILLRPLMAPDSRHAPPHERTGENPRD